MTTPMHQESFCRSCGAPIVFLRTRAGKWMPGDAASVTPGDELYEPSSVHVAHWSTCEDREQWRRAPD
jgi:hypothetical protein